MSFGGNPIGSSTIGIGASYASAFKNMKKEYEGIMLSSKEGSKAAGGWHNMQSDEVGKALHKQQLAANYKQHTASLEMLSENVGRMHDIVNGIRENVENAVESMQRKPLDLSWKDREERIQQMEYYLGRIEESLNAKHSNGEYIFGGARSDATPVGEIVKNSNIISSESEMLADDTVTSVYYNGDTNPAISYTIGNSNSIKLNFNAADPGVRKAIAALHYCIDAEKKFNKFNQIKERGIDPQKNGIKDDEYIDEYEYIARMEHAEKVGDEAVKSLISSVLDIAMVLQHIEIDKGENERMLSETEGSLNDLMTYDQIDLHRFLMAYSEQLNALSNIYMLSHKLENNFINNLASMS